MKDNIKTKREELKSLSSIIQKAVKENIYSNVNEGLVDLYSQQGHTTLHSFNQWKKEGYHVKKGEKALLLWGEPRKSINQEKKSEKENDEFKFFPLAYVFSQLQVEPLAKNM